MLMLRLQRVGRRNESHFKIVVIEKTRGAKSQKYVDIVGSYNPKLGRVQIDEDKTRKWIANGVQPSDTVRNMLIDKGILDGKKVNVLPKKSPVIDEEKLAREKEEAEAKVAEKAAAESGEADSEKSGTETTVNTTEENSVEEVVEETQIENTEDKKEEIVETEETEEIKKEDE